MALDFPTSPSPNQVHTSGSRSWTWNNSVGAWYAVNAGVQGIQGAQGLQGNQGVQGITGLAFTIAKTYASVAALTADTAPTNIGAGQFALINTSNVQDADNSKLYIWDGSSYIFVDDLSGSAGIQGITGSQGTVGSQGAQGITGAQGTVGAQGITGAQGAVGAQGAQGIQGLQGIQGISGASILGLNNTFTGVNSININGTVGATTPSTVAATTIAASGVITQTIANSGYINVNTDASNKQWRVGGGSGGIFQITEVGVADRLTITSTGLNSTAIGATTPSTVAATSGTFSGNVAVGSNAVTISTGGNVTAIDTVQVNSGTIRTTLTYDTGVAVIGSYTNHPVSLRVNQTQVGQLTTTGLNSTAIGATTASTGAFTTVSATGSFTTSAGNLSALAGELKVGSGSKQLNLRTLSGSNRIDSYDNPVTTTVPLVINASTYTFQVADVAKMTLNSTSLAVTGALSSTSTLSAGANTGSTRVRVNGDGTPGFNIDVSGAEKAAFYRNGSEIIVEGASGHGFAINTNGATRAITVNTSQAIRFNAYGAGSLTTDGSGNITAVSDERIKSNIRPFSRGLAEILAINPILHGYTEESGLDQSRDDYAGFSAQQVQAFIPEAIGVNADGMLSFSDRPIMAALVNAVKELTARVAALESN